MKLGEFFVELGLKTDKKGISEIEKTIEKLKELEEEVENEIELENQLKKADTDETKAKIKKKFEIKKQIKEQTTLLKQQKQQIAGTKAMIGSALGLITAFTGVVLIVDRMATALGRSNQQMMNFRATTGISLGTLQRYAQANITANPNASIEGTAQSMSRVASNLWDIQMGRGDVSAYQELSYFSGRNVEPYGKSVTQVIEQVREALKSIDNDVQATNIIQRMGFSPDDLMMLRMTREEFEQTKEMFLSPEDREKLEEYNRQIKIAHMQLALFKDKVLLKILAPLVTLEQSVVNISKGFEKWAKGLHDIIDQFIGFNKAIYYLGIAGFGALMVMNPLLASITALYLLLEDFAVYTTGGESAIELALKGIQDFFDSFKNINVFKNNAVTTWVEEFGGAIEKNFNSQGAKNFSNILTGIRAYATGFLGMGIDSIEVMNRMMKGVGINVFGDDKGNNVTNNNKVSIYTNNPAVAMAVNDKYTNDSYSNMTFG